MSEYVKLRVDYNDDTNTYYSRNFLMVDEVPEAGKDNVAFVYPVALDPSERPRVPLNTYVVVKIDEEMYNLDKENFIYGDVDVKDYYEEEYIAIPEERDLLMQLVHSGEPVLIVDKFFVIANSNFEYELEYDRHRDPDRSVIKRMGGNIDELSNQELFNRYRQTYYEMHGEDFADMIYFHNAEDYSRELSGEQYHAFCKAWKENQNVFDDFLAEREQGIER